MSDPSSWLPNLLGPLNLSVAGVPYPGPRRQNINLLGFTLTDDPTNLATIIESVDTGGGQDTTPLTNGVVNSNVSTGGFGSLRFDGYTTVAILGGLLLPFGAMPVPGQRIELSGTVPGALLVVANLDGASDSQARIITGTGGDVILPIGAQQKAYVEFDGDLQMWRLASTGVITDTRIHSKNFGTYGDLVHDDTVALRAWIASGAALQIVTGQAPHYHLDAGQYLISGTLKWSNLSCPVITGEGAASAIVWGGTIANGGYDPTLANPVAAVHLESCSQGHVSDLVINCPNNSQTFGSSTQARLAEGLRLTTKSGLQISTQNMIDNVTVEGATSEIDLPVRIGGGLNANNDFNTFHNCIFANYRIGAIEVQDAQAYQQIFVNCKASGAFQASASGAMSSSSSPTHLSSTTPMFLPVDAGQVIEVEGAGVAGATLRTTIASYTDSQHVVLAVGASTTVSGAVVNIGAQYAVLTGAAHPTAGQDGTGGTFTWIGGAHANHLWRDFITGPFNNAAVTIRDSNGEGSRGFLYYAGSTAKPIVVEGLRFSGNGMIAEDPYAFDINGNPLLSVRNAQIGDQNVSGLHIKINWNHSLSQVPHNIVFDNVLITSTYTTEQVFTNNQGNCIYPSDIRSLWLSKDGSTFEQVGNRAIVLEGSGTLTVLWNLYRSVLLQIDASATLVFQDPRTGLAEPMRLWLRQNTGAGSPFSVTWPANINWGSAGGPPTLAAGEMCLIELYYVTDGTDQYGFANSTQYMAVLVERGF